MLATLVREPFHKPGWVYEEKYDGYRILAYKQGSRVRLYSRNAIDRTDRFFDVASAMSTLRPATLLLDGEVSGAPRAAHDPRDYGDARRRDTSMEDLLH